MVTDMDISLILLAGPAAQTHGFIAIGDNVEVIARMDIVAGKFDRARLNKKGSATERIELRPQKMIDV